MKALTLTQPWATLVALGIKKVESRSWTTSYRGLLLIHAAKGWTAEDREFAVELQVRGVLPISAGSRQELQRLPLGMFVAIADLADVIPAHHLSGDDDDLEHELGDYSAGRYAWLLDDVKALPDPLPWRGALGIWAAPNITTEAGTTRLVPA